MKRLVVVLGGLLALPAFAEVAPFFYDDVAEYADAEMMDDGAVVGDEIVAERVSLRLCQLGESEGIEGVGVACGAIPEDEPLCLPHGLDGRHLPGRLFDGYAVVPCVSLDHVADGNLAGIGVQFERQEIDARLLLYPQFRQCLLHPDLGDIAERTAEIGPVLDDHATGDDVGCFYNSA